MSQHSMTVESLWHFPVKGLEGACRDSVTLQAGRHFPDDRIFAVGNGHARHEQSPPGIWHKKAFFLQQMQFEQLAELNCAYDGTKLSIHHRGRCVVSGDMDSDDDVAKIDAFFASLVGHQIPGAPHLMRVTDGSYADTKDALISLGGTASVASFGTATGTRPDQRRFRLNIMLNTETPFAENALVGKRVRLGDAELRIVAPVGRCAAIDVDPETAVRGPHYLPVMEQAFGHTDLGIFAEILTGGQVNTGDNLVVLD